ncbi:LLM class flavin-dependent oxidoreductase [Solirubrobacter soli]|uniref:LLM class flavin-dependent oxidoreductase n=1 Tax=Solirubrobacter soli TaxID=363832 RepID=UPI00146CAB8F|nr:LLM class flavin-dependent oxidoreductase [Solirubrobacter soli]
MRTALMIEGQEDVTWEDWVALAEACERSGIEALFRSDHFVSVFGANEHGSLDAWGTINALAARTTKLRFGTMVSPSSFRHPSVLAKLAVTADHVSGGRISLGLGTGWSEVEHTAYGFPFLSMKERMDVLEEQLEIIHDGHFAPGPFSFKGRYYELNDLQARPQPLGHLPLIMGGAAGPRAARLAARYADEYNTVMPTLEQVAERKGAIDAACEKASREPIPFTVMTTCVIGEDQPDFARRLAAFREQTGSDPDATTAVIGTLHEARERLAELEAAGVSGIYLQHLLHRDIEMVELIGEL